MKEHIDRVREFMQKCEHPLPEEPSMPSSSIRVLRAKLILEEALETVEALGLLPYLKTEDPQEPVLDIDRIDYLHIGEPNLVEVIDGCADIMVVTTGTFLACGVDQEPILEEIDKNNLAKFEGDACLREDGKLVKDSNHQKPDVAGLIEKQRVGNTTE